jgi:hypothetical protein
MLTLHPAKVKRWIPKPRQIGTCHILRCLSPFSKVDPHMSHFAVIFRLYRMRARCRLRTANHRAHRFRKKENENENRPCEPISRRVETAIPVLIATCVFTTAANALPIFAGKFTVHYEVHWGQAVLPAGD